MQTYMNRVILISFPKVRIGQVKFNELEKYSNPLREQIQNNFLRASKAINEIRVKGKRKEWIKYLNLFFIDDIYVAFEDQDQIFDLTKEIDREFMEVTDGPDAINLRQR